MACTCDHCKKEPSCRTHAYHAGLDRAPELRQNAMRSGNGRSSECRELTRIADLDACAGRRRRREVNDRAALVACVTDKYSPTDRGHCKPTAVLPTCRVAMTGWAGKQSFRSAESAVLRAHHRASCGIGRCEATEEIIKGHFRDADDTIGKIVRQQLCSYLRSRCMQYTRFTYVLRLWLSI